MSKAVWRTISMLAVLVCILQTVIAEDGVTDFTILIGQTIGLTRTAADTVKEMNEGARAYLAVVNKQGSVNGRKIELRTLDDQYLPELPPRKVPLIAPSTGAESLHVPVNRLIFNVRAKYQNEVVKAIEHFNTLGRRTSDC